MARGAKVALTRPITDCLHHASVHPKRGSASDTLPGQPFDLAGLPRPQRQRNRSSSRAPGWLAVRGMPRLL